MGAASALAWRTQEFQAKVEAFEGRAPAASWFSSPLVVCLGASELENMSREWELEADKRLDLFFSPRNKGLNVGPLSHLKAQGWDLCQKTGPGPTASLLAFAVVEHVANMSGWMRLGASWSTSRCPCL